MLGNLAWLIFAHLLADYPLQGSFLANEKGKNPILLVSHAAIWTGVIVYAAHALGMGVAPRMVAFLFLVHATADALKAKRILWYKRMDPLRAGLLVDQLIHVAQILVLLAVR